MNDRQLKLYVRVVDAGSFSKAAREGYVTTQSVAQHIARLEEEVGVKLLERTGQGVVQTEAGRAFYDGAVALDREITSLLVCVRSLGNPERDLVRLGSSENYSLELFARFVPEYLRLHPGIDIDYCTVGSNPLNDLRTGAYDIVEGTSAQVWDLDGSEGIEFVPLITTRRCCVVSTLNPLARKKVVEPKDLLGAKVYVFSYQWASQLRAYLDEVCPGIDIHELSELPTHDHRSLGRGPDAKDAVGLMPEHMAERYAPLVSVPFDVDVAIEYGLLFRSDQRERLSSFVNAAREYFNAHTA